MKRSIFVLLVLVGWCMASVMTLNSRNAEKTEINENNDYVGYLFTYFKGNEVEEEAICYAISRDGYKYYAINNNRPIIESAKISSTGGVRDPHILRCEDEKTFYMVVTDMTSSLGWDSNRAMVLMKSTDLVNWTSSVINIQQKYEGQEELKRVWAPQTIYDPQANKYMVYWSMQYTGGPDIIYYAYANEDFTDIEGKPEVLFLPQNKKSCIDGDIVYKDGLFYMFYKTEGDGNGLKLATTPSLTSGNWTEYDDYKQQTKEAVEGSSIFKLINSDTYILMYDVYMKGEYEFAESKDLMNFNLINNEISMDFHPRHGSIIPITASELKNITDKWGYPRRYLSSVGNPVLDGYYADPEILYSHKTGKYYLYPTSDGYLGWGGYSFNVFSSDDLIHWIDEGVFLDLSTDQVTWADGNAWAPCIEEKLIDGEYKYFYYFSGNPVGGGAKQIGVAIANHPTGPFVDSGRPLLTSLPEGVSGGQQIDPDVFTDPVSGKSYLYWGNGYAAVAELNDDMISLKDNTTKVITPDDTFREGIYVVYREGTYYFFWSEDDTGSENYKVRYGTSSSPTGPIEVPRHNIVVQKKPEKGIYGTGHNSIIQVPGTDEWYIVYHRFKHPRVEHPGNHRQVAIDRLEFNKDGSIREVIPTN